MALQDRTGVIGSQTRGGVTGDRGQSGYTTGTSNGKPERDPFALLVRHNAADLILQNLLRPRPPENEDAEAQLCWGGESDFSAEPPAVVYAKPPVPDNSDGGDGVESVSTITFTEVSRKVTKIRVENPSDAEQYVMVEDATEIIFRSDRDNILRKFVFAAQS